VQRGFCEKKFALCPVGCQALSFRKKDAVNAVGRGCRATSGITTRSNTLKERETRAMKEELTLMPTDKESAPFFFLFLLFKTKKREAAETIKTREKIGQKQVGKFQVA
jgi:hypothetical protein